MISLPNAVQSEPVIYLAEKCINRISLGVTHMDSYLERFSKLDEDELVLLQFYRSLSENERLIIFNDLVDMVETANG